MDGRGFENVAKTFTELFSHQKKNVDSTGFHFKKKLKIETPCVVYNHKLHFNTTNATLILTPKQSFCY